MSKLMQGSSEVYRALDITREQMLQISRSFCAEMDLNLESSSLKMLRCPICLPKGDEKGTFVALDLGGTMARALLVRLAGAGEYSVLAKSEARIWDGNSPGEKSLDAGTLFDKLAGLVAGILPNASFGKYRLGFTFSYPVNQNKINRAKLIKWAKEISVPGMEGKDVGEALQEALLWRNLPVKVATITNDTISTLLAGAYTHRDIDLGSIIGTGHNTCFVRRSDGPEAQVINIEAGNFNAVPRTDWDRKLDSFSSSPGEQCLEKMVAGRYQGELFRLIMLDLVREAGLLPGLDQTLLQSPLSITAEDMAGILSDKHVKLLGVQEWVRTKLKVRDCGIEELGALKGLAAGISRRAAKLVAATYGGILANSDPELYFPHGVAIDGSIYHKLPGFGENLRSALALLFNTPTGVINTVPVFDGSGIGAAVATAVNIANPI